MELAPGDDAAVRNWASSHRIEPEWVRSRRVTLNHDAGALENLTNGQERFPTSTPPGRGAVAVPGIGSINDAPIEMPSDLVIVRWPGFPQCRLEQWIGSGRIPVDRNGAGYPHTLLYAVALTESGKQIKPAGGYRPWPWT